MNVRRIDPIRGPVDVSVEVPGSKSIANRALVCAALARGESHISRVPDGDDTRAMLDGLRRLGLDGEAVGGDVRMTGLGGGPAVDGVVVDAGLAGTTSRFLTAVASLSSGPITIDGAPPLRRRPFGPLHDALAQMGVAVLATEGRGTLPARIAGPPVSGRVEIPGDVSSQFVTALMLIGPYLPGGLDLVLSSPLVSRPYVELTARVMGWFDGPPVDIGVDRVTVAPGGYAGRALEVEPDASSASYPLAVAAVAGGRCEVPGLGSHSPQGDAVFADILSRMGCSVHVTDHVTAVRRDPEKPLSGVDLDMADASDLVPTLAAVACHAASPSRIRGVGFIRSKESDRLGDLVAELNRAGASATETDDGLVIEPSVSNLRHARLATHHDHRLAMAFAVLGCAGAGLDIEDPDVVTKSWPAFWDEFAAWTASTA